MHSIVAGHCARIRVDVGILYIRETDKKQVSM